MFVSDDQNVSILKQNTVSDTVNQVYIVPYITRQRDKNKPRFIYDNGDIKLAEYRII